MNYRSLVTSCCMAAAAVALGGGATAPALATGGSIAAIREHNVFLFSADGHWERQLTSDGTAADPYASPSQSTDGTIAALRSDVVSLLQGDGTAAADPVPLGGNASRAALSPDGTTIAYETASFCGIIPRACMTTFFRPVGTGGPEGEVIQLKSPAWVGRTIIGALSCGVWAETVGADDQDKWLEHPDGPDFASLCLNTVAASPDGTKIAAGGTGNGYAWLAFYVAGGVRQPAELRCYLQLEPGAAAPQVSWAPDGTAVSWEESTGIWTTDVGDLAPGTCEGLGTGARHLIGNASSPAWGTAQLGVGKGGDGKAGDGNKGGSGQVKLDRLRVSPKRLPRGRKLTIRFRLSAAAPVRLEIRRGGKRRVKATLDGDAGSNRYLWSGKSKGRPLPVGRYVLRASLRGGRPLAAKFRIVGRR